MLGKYHPSRLAAPVLGLNEPTTRWRQAATELLWVQCSLGSELGVLLKLSWPRVAELMRCIQCLDVGAG